MKELMIIAALAVGMTAWAQNDSTKVEKDSTKVEKDSIEGFRFTTVDSVGITPVKDQNRSSTCWAFSTLGFLESEVLREKGKVVDFSEMYVVSKTMIDRATATIEKCYDESEYPDAQAVLGDAEKSFISSKVVTASLS